MVDNETKAFGVNTTIPTIVGIIIGVIFLTFIITFIITKKSNPKDDGLITLGPSLNINDCSTAFINGPITLEECRNFVGKPISDINPGNISKDLKFTDFNDPNYPKHTCLETSPQRKKSMQDIVAGVTYIPSDPLGRSSNNLCWMYSDSSNKLNYNMVSPTKIPDLSSPIQDRIWALWKDPNNNKNGIHTDPAAITIYDPNYIHVNLT